MRYLLFGSNACYYASGGAHDFLGAGNSIDDLTASECLGKKSGRYIEWFHIFDTETMEIVAGSETQPYGAPDLDEIGVEL